MEFKALGDQAILVSFAQKIDPGVNAEVIRLKNAIEKAKISGINFCIPAYCSLTVGYDALQIKYDKLCQKIKLLEIENLNPKTVRRLSIPVCYEEPLALDFPEVIQQTGLTKKEIIDLHSSITYQVYMLGFLPGFPYLGKLPESLFCKRKVQPRVKVPAGSVGLAGLQTGIYPSEAPGGWQIIGRTPIPVLSTRGEPPLLLKAGDRVQFKLISLSDFENISKDIAAGDFDLNSIYD